MHLTRRLSVMLNRRDWDRRAWEIGYRGPSLAKKKSTGRPHAPITPQRLSLLRERFEREHQVMRWLSTPFLNKQAEQQYIKQSGTHEERVVAEQKKAKLSRMPGKPKELDAHGNARPGWANYGNLLHEPRTIEDSLRGLLKEKRWD